MEKDLRLVICGGRNYQFTAQDYNRLTEIHARHNVVEVVSGGCEGADRCGEHWAMTCANVGRIRTFPADWDKYGKKAGPIRNQAMADYTNATVAFPGGRGTQDMLKRAKKAGHLIWDFTKTTEPAPIINAIVLPPIAWIGISCLFWLAVFKLAL